LLLLGDFHFLFLFLQSASLGRLVVLLPFYVVVLHAVVVIIAGRILRRVHGVDG